MADATDRPRQIAVVTGASHGLGKALAIELAVREVAVAGIARDPETLKAALADHAVLPVAADIGDTEAVARAFAEIRETLGDPTILINNAALYPHRDILDETPESFLDTLNVNLGGAFRCCHEVLPAMIKKGTGRIVNVATFADIRPAPLAAGYSVSKGAMRILTKSLIADLGDRFPGIVINDWIPGALRTRMGLADGIEPATAARWGATLALMQDRSINGLIFDQDREYMVAKSLKQRLKESILNQKRPPIRLDRPASGQDDSTLR